MNTKKELVLEALIKWLIPFSKRYRQTKSLSGEDFTGIRALVANIVLSGLVVDYNGFCKKIELDVDYINSTRFGYHLDLLGFNVPVKEVRSALLNEGI